MRTRTPQLIAYFALSLLLPVARLASQPPPAQPANPPAAGAAADAAVANRPAQPDAATSAGAAMRTQNAAGQDTLSVDFPDEDIRSILRNVADLFELNLAMPDGLQGKTTIKLKDVTWRQIFTTVLQPVNYTFVEEGNIIKIVSNDSLLQEPTSTEVFLINYAKASDILPTITSLVDSAAGGKIVVDARSNALVITERPSRMGRIRPIIEALDRATDQVMIEAKFVEVTNSDVKNLGVNWSSLANYQISAGSLKGDFNRTRDQKGSSTATNTINNTANNNRNNTGTQTNGATNANNVTSTAGVPSGTSSSGTTGALDSTVTTTVGAISSNALDNLISLANGDSTARSMSAVFSANDFSLVLSALQTLQNTKIVSNPTIVTLNNTPAVIKVGQERPIPSYTYNSERGVYEVSGFTYKPIGIILSVTPQVNARGDITLAVQPEVSQSSRDANFNGASIPIVESRTASTRVSLKDGYTMGIGGLLQTASTNSNNKVPLLGDIPIVGRLFRSDTKNLESTNLIIFITAKTISASGAPVEQTFDSSRVRELNMRREDLPGYRDGSNPFLPSAAPNTSAAPAPQNATPPAKPFFRLTTPSSGK